MTLQTPSSSRGVDMRGVVLVCLLHVALTRSQKYSWNKLDRSAESPGPDVCLVNQASCGCCLMQKQMRWMEWFFDVSQEELKQELSKTKMNLNNMRGSRSVFSVALNDTLTCYGPFADDAVVVYKHVFINLGDGYDVQTGIFAAPRSGVYSIALTLYTDLASGSGRGASCASLRVNGREVATLLERHEKDREDSATAVVAVPLKAGDQVAVVMPMGCVICDHNSRFNTFTGFLLYPSD